MVASDSMFADLERSAAELERELQRLRHHARLLDLQDQIPGAPEGIALYRSPQEPDSDEFGSDR